MERLMKPYSNKEPLFFVGVYILLIIIIIHIIIINITTTTIYLCIIAVY